jgi:regulator of RNase E activity RraB
MIDDYPNDSDGDALRRVARDGSDMTKPMFIEFHVAVPNEESANGLAVVARKLGYYVQVYASPECRLPWTCQCSTRMIADFKGVVSVQNELAEISRKFGGIPDGWGTFGNGPSGSLDVLVGTQHRAKIYGYSRDSMDVMEIVAEPDT